MDASSQERLLKWYGDIHTRRVDLVGDYAGNELFIVEGDSLLLRCFEDTGLDFQDGFQLLHAVYNVENFLQNLRQRKCNFHIVFFKSHESLCIPPGTRNADRSKYLLARAAIYRHFDNLLPESTSIELHSFLSPDDQLFKEYLTANGVYFVMSHDGASSDVGDIGELKVGEVENRSLESKSESEISRKVVFRSMIFGLLQTGYNVALINGLGWQDTKVMTEVVEGHRSVKEPLQLADLPQSNSTSKSFPGNHNFPHSDGMNVETDDMTALQNIQTTVRSKGCICNCQSERTIDTKQWTQRSYLTVLALRKVILQNPELAKFTSACLQHVAFLVSLPLRQRRLSLQDSTRDHLSEVRFMENLNCALATFLNSEDVYRSINSGALCDVSDLVDGRLFRAKMEGGFSSGSAEAEVFEDLACLLCMVSGTHPKRHSDGMNSESMDSETDKDIGSSNFTIMPFSNSVFDKHLAPVKLAVSSEKPSNVESGRIFREVTHWHSAKKKLITKTATPLSGRDKMKIARRNDNFMAEMQTYAASLTNATGKSLEPEVVTVGKSDMTGLHPEGAKENGMSKQLNPKAQVKGKGGKKQKMLEEIAANKSAKDSDNADKVFSAWVTVRKNYDGERSLVGKYHKLTSYLRDLSTQKRAILGAEVQYSLVCILIEIYRETRKGSPRGPSSESLGVRALLFDTLRKLPDFSGFTKTLAGKVKEIVTAFSFPSLDFEIPSTDRKLAYDPKVVLPKEDARSSLQDNQNFQLLHCGPYMDRNLDSAPDSRVPFSPDGWQRKVLDELDLNHSLFVVAPTSAGKTFISFYAMEKILRSNDESVLVYVAPTKALVNQIAAEVQARFQKKYKFPGHSVWAIHTRDYRINNPTGCQVLVTVPHILQIMLLAPTNAKAWSSKVRYIIFDEIHSIGQADDGVVWEQLLLLAPCPIIALSATVGNPDNFSSWLSDTQKSLGHELTTVQHTHRYSDLRKFVYYPPKKFSFRGLTDRATFGVLGLDGVEGLAYIHPVSSLINKSRGMPPDLSLEARDCLLLYESMARHQTKDHPVDQTLSPANSIKSTVIRKADIIQWENRLKTLLKAWMADDESPFDEVIDELSKSMEDARTPKQNGSVQAMETNAGRDPQGKNDDDIDRDDLFQTTLPLICKLQERNALPAIFFNYDRSKCEGICEYVTKQLEEAEAAWKESSPAWKAKLNGFELYKKEKAKLASKKVPKQATKKKGQEDDDPKADKLLDATSDDADPYAGFDPEDPVDGYHFAAKHKAEAGELAKYFGQLRWRNLPEHLIAGLKRGVGVHHAGMNRKYRQIVEMLFRKGYLRVVIATGTLALGINMPCATVVFSGDSVFLTALNFRQAAGRAGRRGFDLLGNVVFQGISRGKICRLLSSRLPDLNGHFPVTTTLILRLFTLLHDSNNSHYATRAINSLLSQPRLYLDGPAFREQVLHHLRYYIEYLRRQDLLKNSSFALNCLIKNGYLHDLCSDINVKESHVLRGLMLVLSHLFGRRVCRQADAEYLDRVKHSSSIVFLPPLPPKAADSLRQHNKDTLQTFTTYVRTFVDQHMGASIDSALPLTGLTVGGTEEHLELSRSLPPTKVRSAFVALSGHGDDFATISELCRTARSGVFLEEAVIPYVSLHPEETKTPLNAYLYDFFMHGDIHTLERANGVRKAEVWFLLNDFSLVLATIVASLANFMKLPESDISLEDLAGEGDEQENLEDDKFADDSTVASEATGTSTATGDTGRTSISTSSLASRPKKKKVVDSWDDAADEEEAQEANEAEKELEEDISKDEIERGFLNIYKSMVKLRAEFDTKFRKIFA